MSSEGWFTFWEVLAAIGTTIVIVGLFLEYGPDTFTFLKFWGEREISGFRVKVETPTERKGDVLVVLGIAIELIGGVGIIVQSYRLELQHRKEVATLEAQLSWRELTPQQEKLIVAATAPFPRQRADVFWYAGNPEAENFGNQIIALLKREKWDAE